jgi:menaquinone-specific isochorismate synthase
MIGDPRAALAVAARFGDRHTIAAAAVPAPRLGAEAVARALGDDLDWLWRAPDGELLAGAGSAAQVSAEGPGRFLEARDGALALLARVSRPDTRLFGGFAFAPGSAAAPEWRGFGDGGFELPRIAYRAGATSAELTAFFRDPLDPGRRRRALAELEDVAARLAVVGTAGPASDRRGAERIDAGDRDRYRSLVAEVAADIRGGRFSKVVLARRARFEVGDLDVPLLLGDLDRAYRGCFLLFRRGEAGALVAASPERLLRVRGAVVETAALAGTTASADADTLLSSTKLQLEHELTARHIATALAEAGCASVEVDAPRIRALPGLAHLETPIRARRAARAHLFDLAGAVHPTPAVAGLPASAACQVIREREPMARGWYAGPVGWVDAAGDGELAIALRAALIDLERPGTLWLYAGAGIVGESDPDAEWEETALKLDALGAHLAGTPVDAAPRRIEEAG